MEQQVIEISNLQCQLCLKGSERLKEYKCIEQNLILCKDCQQLLTRKFYSYYAHLYKKDMKVNYSSTYYYKVQVQKCEFCYEEKICCKICVNDHYFCLDCCQSYSNVALNNRITKCPLIDCGQEIDHYIISLFLQSKKFDKWKIFNQTMFCPNKHCVNQIYFSPYSNVKTQIIRIDDKYSECSSCQSKICNNCWTQFKNSYNQHEEKCTSEKFRNQLLQKYLIDNSVSQCPKCKWWSEIECSKKVEQIQQCQFCQTYFCLICNSGDQKLFSTVCIFDNWCPHCCKKLLKEQLIQEILFVLSVPFVVLFFTISILFFIILIPLFIFFELGERLTKYIQKKWLIAKFKYKSQIFYLLIPFILIFYIVAQFFKYTAMILPSICDCLFGFPKLKIHAQN